MREILKNFARKFDATGMEKVAVGARRPKLWLMFELLATDPGSKARRARLTTGHGVVETPVNFGQTGHT